MPDDANQAKKTPGWVWVLLGCGGALLLVMIIAIIAAIAIPSLLAARRSSQETVGVASCRAYSMAQVMYKKNDWDGDKVLSYAAPNANKLSGPSFYVLYATPDPGGTPVGLLDGVMANASSPLAAKQGYYFTDMKTVGGQPINWVNDYALCASPAIYGRTGYRTFIVSTDGTVYGKDLGAGAPPPTDYPANPMAEGWIIAE
ncbi:MAG TPA: DUF2950 family protein [Planctomycetota bacterium]|nr:DUF2950 family protein [Planctomycetota bacterium]